MGSAEPREARKDNNVIVAVRKGAIMGYGRLRAVVGHREGEGEARVSDLKYGECLN